MYSLFGWTLLKAMKSGKRADQIRTVDKSRLVKKLGQIDDLSARSVLNILREMFAP